MKKNNDIQLIRTACPAHCGIDACGILAHVKGERIIKLEPAEFPLKKDRRICLRGLTSLDITYHPDRIKYPMKRIGKRGAGKFERITWDEAYNIIVENFKSIAEKYGWRAIGWVLGGPGAGTTKFGAYLRLASLTQSTRVSAWGYGDAGLPCGTRIILGHQFPYLYLQGTFWQRNWPDLLVIWGTNPGESMPLQNMRKIMDAKEEGTQVVVIDPRFTITASKADQYIGLKPGTDSALALGLMNVIFQNNLHDTNFIREFTNGTFLVRTDTGKLVHGKDIGVKKTNAYVLWDKPTNSAKVVRRKNVKEAMLTGTYIINDIECKPVLQILIELANEYTLEKTAEITGVKAELIEKLAIRIASAKNVTFLTHMGFTRTFHGDISIRGLISVASITGNVLTSVSSGYIPAALNWEPFLKAIPDEPSFHRLGILNLYNAVIEGKPFQIKAVWFAFINFLNQCANSNKLIDEFFPNLDFIVQTELFMT
ncbi:MAG: molybdopterin-dependent oxidoreductase, partial [Candidatus Odinarchaeota archaeon]